MKRWLRFNAVGVMGAGVQLGVLALLLRLHVQYLVATAMRLFTGAMGWPPVPSNLAAITITSLLNFLTASRWVFTRLRRGRAIM